MKSLYKLGSKIRREWCKFGKFFFILNYYCGLHFIITYQYVHISALQSIKFRENLYVECDQKNWPRSVAYKNSPAYLHRKIGKQNYINYSEANERKKNVIVTVWSKVDKYVFDAHFLRKLLQYLLLRNFTVYLASFLYRVAFHSLLIVAWFSFPLAFTLWLLYVLLLLFLYFFCFYFFRILAFHFSYALYNFLWTFFLFGWNLHLHTWLAICLHFCVRKFLM